ncbi:hypothetical protein GCM10023191_033100 [Actinoallomurus oryzae]|uniref:OmpR/PhoB-type domain-containing protein n=1 Tax=Actinoallomurus oryzae TaxID=502180 RepID=A0ABP8PWC8_9ACTN
MTQHRSPNRASRHLVDLDARYRERLHRGHALAPVETVPADGTLLDVVPLPDTGKVLMIVAHVVPASAVPPGSPPESDGRPALFPAPPRTTVDAQTPADAPSADDASAASPASGAGAPPDGASPPLGVIGQEPSPAEWPEANPVRRDDAPSEALRIDPSSRRVWVEGREIGLTYQEFELLAHFTTHPWQVFSRTDLMRALWPAVDATTRTVDVHVHRLRRKLGSAGSRLATVRRVGYTYRPHDVHRAEPAQAGE